MPIATGQPVRILIVDERVLAGEQLRRDLAGRPEVGHVVIARTADEAVRAVNAQRPDVAVVDVAVRGCLTALRNRLPVLAMAGHERASVSAGLFAVEGGAVDLWVRPAPSTGATSEDHNDGVTLGIADLLRRATAAAMADAGRQDTRAVGQSLGGSAAGVLLAFGAGIGATVSLGNVLASLPGDAAGVVASTLPAAAVELWAERTGRRTAVALSVARDGGRITPGRIWIAPGDRHLMVRPTNDGGWAVCVRDGPRVNGGLPSLDVMFSSVAACGPAAAAALLGGVGSDGANGLLIVRRGGGRTAAESSGTAACGELVAEAARCGAAEVSAPAEHLVAALLDLTAGRRSNRAA